MQTINTNKKVTGDGLDVSLNCEPEITPQDLGKPSPVPYSIFFMKPSADIGLAGREVIKINLAIKDLDCGLENLLPSETRPLLGVIRGLFRNGYYRFEATVGDWSIKVYKHPNNA